MTKLQEKGSMIKKIRIGRVKSRERRKIGRRRRRSCNRIQKSNRR